MLRTREYFSNTDGVAQTGLRVRETSSRLVLLFSFAACCSEIMRCVEAGRRVAIGQRVWMKFITTRRPRNRLIEATSLPGWRGKTTAPSHRARDTHFFATHGGVLPELVGYGLDRRLFRRSINSISSRWRPPFLSCLLHARSYWPSLSHARLAGATRNSMVIDGM